MAFLQRNFYPAAQESTSFTPLFRLLEDFDSYSRHGHPGRRVGLPQWQPKFDIRETEAAYELHGELPGVSKKDVHIEFTDPQTMFVRGKAERTYTAGTPPANLVPGAQAGRLVAGSEADTVESDESAAAAQSNKATVEDANEDGSLVQADRAKVEPAARTQTKTNADTAKYWLTERSIGEFSRNFNFPSRVDQDSVTASFQDGILNIVVPKAKHESRRITVN